MVMSQEGPFYINLTTTTVMVEPDSTIKNFDNVYDMKTAVN